MYVKCYISINFNVSKSRVPLRCINGTPKHLLIHWQVVLVAYALLCVMSYRTLFYTVPSIINTFRYAYIRNRRREAEAFRKRLNYCFNTASESSLSFCLSRRINFNSHLFLLCEWEARGDRPEGVRSLYRNHHLIPCALLLVQGKENLLRRWRLIENVPFWRVGCDAGGVVGR